MNTCSGRRPPGMSAHNGYVTRLLGGRSNASSTRSGLWTVINCGMSLHLFLYKSVPAWKKCFAMQKAASARAECPSASNLAERNRVTQEFLTTIFADDRQTEKSKKTTNITKLCWLKVLSLESQCARLLWKLSPASRDPDVQQI